MDYPGNKRPFPARSFADDIPESNRRGGVPMECDYGFIFLEDYGQTQRYFELRRTGHRKEAAKYLNSRLLRRRVENPRRRIIAERPAARTDPQPETLSSVLHRLVDVIASDERFGFLTEEEIDRAVSVVKSLADTRMTYKQAADELGCTVPALHTRVCRERIKTEHVVYLRRRDVERLRRRKARTDSK